jgi:hypothetical protein
MALTCLLDVGVDDVVPSSWPSRSALADWASTHSCSGKTPVRSQAAGLAFNHQHAVLIGRLLGSHSIISLIALLVSKLGGETPSYRRGGRDQVSSC